MKALDLRPRDIIQKRTLRADSTVEVVSVERLHEQVVVTYRHEPAHSLYPLQFRMFLEEWADVTAHRR